MAKKMTGKSEKKEKPMDETVHSEKFLKTALKDKQKKLKKTSSKKK